MSCYLLFAGENNLRLCIHWMWGKNMFCDMVEQKKRSVLVMKSLLHSYQSYHKECDYDEADDL